MSEPATKPIEVLVVDDSAVVRQVMVRMLAAAPELHVTVASDPIFALAKMQQTRPHVIVLDLEMPRMDGLSFLRKIMAEDPIPVIICSALAERDGSVVLRALEEGAVDVVAKPAWGLRDFIAESAALFVDKVRAAAQARVVRSPLSRSPAAAAVATTERKPPAVRGDRSSGVVIGLGASTGGTQALRKILSELAGDLPPIAMVQHMPAGFTNAFARDLDRTSQLEVREAEDGDRLVPGLALLACGDRHLSVTRTGGHLVARVTDGERVSRHRPSVNVLFRSICAAVGPLGVGVILTGMGDDGADGLLELRHAGGRTVAQDEASSIIFGMPGQAIERGAAERVVALSEMARVITTLAHQTERQRR